MPTRLRRVGTVILAYDPGLRRLYRRAALVAIGGNAHLALAKGWLAWMMGSSAILSE